MIIQDVINALEELAPLSYAEDFDNVGLLVGEKKTKVSGILVTLDTLENVVDEAIEKNCNLIVSFHPIVFSGIKKINGKNYVERVVIKAIQHNIAIFAIHTALDNCFTGVNNKICDMLKLNNRKVLIHQKNTIKKLITFVPKNDAEKVREALFNEGAGSIGNYTNCSFNINGTGTFNGNENANPVIGRKGETHFEEEIQIGVTFLKHKEPNILKALQKSHPYEEIAYEITTLENQNQHIGIGMIGDLEEPIPALDFLKELKTIMKTDCVRYTNCSGKTIQKVAVLGGSGSFAIENAKNAGADVFVTADVKYHQFYQSENKMIIADIGHYETEQFTKNLLVEYLTKKFPNFAVVLSVCNTNPIKYL
ncbi:Nif3-like dinuclear metal center hexameric protein [Zhouia sp. PK063]|uniref:Nif3-like dinuclear metal center hexameric protein n=1 Tax=Zhouia sp. PK063 TaxID=3373602 RepID=UPI003788282C